MLISVSGLLLSYNVPTSTSNSNCLNNMSGSDSSLQDDLSANHMSSTNLDHTATIANTNKTTKTCFSHLHDIQPGNRRALAPAWGSKQRRKRSVTVSRPCLEPPAVRPLHRQTDPEPCDTLLDHSVAVELLRACQITLGICSKHPGISHLPSNDTTVQMS